MRAVVSAAVMAMVVGGCGDDRDQDLPILRRPVVPARLRAIGPVDELPADARRAFDPGPDFRPRPTPAPGDWLAQHKERGQTFDAYARAGANRPDAARHVLYLQPLGELSTDAPPLDDLVAVVHAFFQLEVRVLPAMDVAAAGATERINRHTHRPQLLTTDLLRFLAGRVPTDAYALMAVTMVDLYPADDWNFVYGQATFVDRVGVQSFARYDPAFLGDARPADWQRTLARRAAQVLVHEITHMFGVAHCVYWDCVIAGVNHQAEADAHPLHLCPVDLRKLWWAVGFDLARREDELAAAWHRLGQDDEAAWSTRRAAWIRGDVTPAAGHAP